MIVTIIARMNKCPLNGFVRETCETRVCYIDNKLNFLTQYLYILKIHMRRLIYVKFTCYCISFMNETSIVVGIYI